MHFALLQLKSALKLSGEPRLLIARSSTVLQRVAVHTANPDACTLCPLHFRHRPFLAGCDDALLQARSQSGAGGRRSGGSGGGGGGNDDGETEGAWVMKAGQAVRDLLLQLARAGGSRALEELRAAAAAGSFNEVARALSAAEAEAAAAPAAPASPSTAAPARVCAACGAAGAALVCSGCRGVRYCGAECQKRDWGAHKAACRARRQRQQEGAAATASQQQQ